MFSYKKLVVASAMALVVTQGCFAHNDTVELTSTARQRKVLIAKVAVGTAVVAALGAGLAYRYSDRFKAVVDSALSRVHAAQAPYTSVVAQKVTQGWNMLTAGMQNVVNRAKNVVTRVEHVAPVVEATVDQAPVVQVPVVVEPVLPVVTLQPTSPEPMEVLF